MPNIVLNLQIFFSFQVVECRFLEAFALFWFTPINQKNNAKGFFYFVLKFRAIYNKQF